MKCGSKSAGNTRSSPANGNASSSEGIARKEVGVNVDESQKIAKTQNTEQENRNENERALSNTFGLTDAYLVLLLE